MNRFAALTESEEEKFAKSPTVTESEDDWIEWIEEVETGALWTTVVKKDEKSDENYDYFCIVDFECTCDDTVKIEHEIIEFPAVFLNTRTGEIDVLLHYAHWYRPRDGGQCTTITARAGRV